MISMNGGTLQRADHSVLGRLMFSEQFVLMLSPILSVCCCGIRLGDCMRAIQGVRKMVKMEMEMTYFLLPSNRVTEFLSLKTRQTLRSHNISTCLCSAFPFHFT